MVAPHAGAWIETLGGQNVEPLWVVAPHAGAWIETYAAVMRDGDTWSLPTRERGLKHRRSKPHRGRRQSLPTRERGLKLLRGYYNADTASRSPRGSVD